MNKQQTNIEMEVQCRLGLPGDTELIQHIRGFGDRNRRYIDSRILDEILSKRIDNPSNLEYIAKDLAIYDPKNITIGDVLLYGQVLEALKRAENFLIPRSMIEEWASKLLAVDQNPKSFNYLLNMKSEEILKEEAKMEGIERGENTENMNIVYSGKKRQQYETSSDEEANTNLSGVINQMQDLRISTSSYQKPVKHPNEEIKKSAITVDLDKNNIKEKKAKKSQESTSVFLCQMEREKALEQDQKNIELINEDKNEIPILLDTIEQSQWSPTNRICDKNRSFKANMPAYAMPGANKEERLKYTQWILRGNHHIKTIKEVFKNGNSWIEVDFDCEFSRDAAMDRIKEKEGDWLKLIPEEEPKSQEKK
jgi:hypothetical protein